MPTSQELWTMIGAILVTLVLASILLGGCASSSYTNAEWHHYTRDQEKWGK